MTMGTADAEVGQLSLPQELVLMLLNEESGYFRQVRGWNLNCAMVGAGLAELSLIGRIDTDMDSLQLLDSTPTGHAALDPILEAIVADPDQHNAQYWVEVLAPRADTSIDVALERLAEMDILQHHEGEFWTLTHSAWQSDQPGEGGVVTAAGFVRSRITRVIFEDEIPDPRDAILISLLNTCDVLRFIFQLEPEAEARIALVCRMDLIGQAIAEAVAQNLAGPLVRQSGLKRNIPRVKALRILRNPHIRDGNLPALMADLYREYGPVFEVHQPFQQPITVLAGPESNRWAQREGRLHLTSTRYLDNFERAYGSHGIIHALDNSDHFRMRKALQSSFAPSRLEEHLGSLYAHARAHMAEWVVGETYQAKAMTRLLANSQISPIIASIESQDIVQSLMDYKERALSTLVAKLLPKFLLHTPAMRRAAKRMDTYLGRIERSHTATQRAGGPRDLIDDLLSLHASDPQLLPESSLRFALSTPVIVSLYTGDELGFALYTMATKPDLYERIRAEAEAIFADGDPASEVFNSEQTEVTRRFVLEVLRMHPVATSSVRDVMNSCAFADFELPLGARVLVMQTASHYVEECFPEPFKFDIDRYLPGRDEHRSTAYAPFGLGTHSCMGQRWVELQMAINLLMVAYYFDIGARPSNGKMRISPLPAMSVSNGVKLRIAAKRREIPTVGPANLSAPAMVCPVAH